MPHARRSTRLPRIEAGLLNAGPGIARDDDWSEIEALLASPARSRARRNASRGWSRGFAGIAGIAALIAIGGLALAGLGVAERAGHSNPFAEKAAMPSTVMAIPPRTQVASAPRATTPIEEGRSVAAGTPPAARDEAPRDAVAASPATDLSTLTVGPVAADTIPSRRHRHRQKHH